jgi:hypothetical protein
MSQRKNNSKQSRLFSDTRGFNGSEIKAGRTAALSCQENTPMVLMMNDSIQIFFPPDLSLAKFPTPSSILPSEWPSAIRLVTLSNVKWIQDYCCNHSVCSYPSIQLFWDSQHEKSCRIDTKSYVWWKDKSLLFYHLYKNLWGEKMEFLFPKVCFYVFKRQRISPKWQPIAYIVHCFCIACCLRVKLWVLSLDYFVVILLPSLQFSSLSTVDCRLINMFSLVHTWISSCRYFWALLWSTIYTNWDVYHWCIPQPSRFSFEWRLYTPRSRQSLNSCPPGQKSWTLNISPCNSQHDSIWWHKCNDCL